MHFVGKGEGLLPTIERLAGLCAVGARGSERLRRLLVARETRTPVPGFDERLSKTERVPKSHAASEPERRGSPSPLREGPT